MLRRRFKTRADLGVGTAAPLPLRARFVVVLPLPADRRRPVRVVVMEAVEETLAVLEFCPVDVTRARRLRGETCAGSALVKQRQKKNYDL